ncbi:MAG: TldD/PmbA family protein [Terriglobales bacterium]
MRELAERVIAEASRRGATAAECVIRYGRELSVSVRMDEVESIKQAEGKALGIRVFKGQQAGVTHSSDLAWPAVSAMLDAALAIAEASSPDPAAGLPRPQDLGQLAADLQLYDPTVLEVSADQALDLARRAERAALACDPRLTNCNGASFDAGEGTKILANSLGFLGEVRRSSCSLSVAPIAEHKGAKQRDYWYTVSRGPSGLEAPEQVGRIAAERTLRRLGARRAATGRYPVVFEPQTARTLLGHIFDAASGESIYREASFLTGALGREVAAPLFTLVDDGSLPGALGSSPFDAEGVPTRRTVIVGDGRLQSYLLNTYAARKLSLATTGNAARGLAAAPGVSCGNLTLLPGASTPEDIIAAVPQGLYVTELIGFGVNTVTGDYSRGASGLWIENGQLAYPVEEITIAGNLKDILRNITAIGNDLEIRGAVNAPTLRVDGLTVAGR